MVWPTDRREMLKDMQSLSFGTGRGAPTRLALSNPPIMYTSHAFTRQAVRSAQTLAPLSDVMKRKLQVFKRPQWKQTAK